MDQHLQQKVYDDDISFILSNPWSVTEYEWTLREKEKYEFNLWYLKARLLESYENGYVKIWRTSDGEPIAVLGSYQVGDKFFESFFVASKHMKEHAMRLSFEMRKILREQSKNYKGHKLRLYSDSEHPSQLSWFKFLGFHYVPEKNEGKKKYFEYIASK